MATICSCLTAVCDSDGKKSHGALSILSFYSFRLHLWMDQVRNKILMIQFSTNKIYNNPFGKDKNIGKYHILLSGAIKI